jgi:hypothetical protein
MAVATPVQINRGAHFDVLLAAAAETPARLSSRLMATNTEKSPC